MFKEYQHHDKKNENERNKKTLKQTYSREYPRVQYAFKDSMIH